MKSVLDLIGGFLFPKLRITEEKTIKDLTLNGKVVMRNTHYRTWYHGINPRTEDYSVTVRAKDEVILRDFDFNTYSQGLIASGCNVEIKTSYKKEEKLL